MQCKTKSHKIQTQTNLCTVKWASETKPNPENCKNSSSKCAYDCAESFNIYNTTQNSSDNILSYLQTNIIAQMLSDGGEGVTNRQMD